LPRAVLIVDDSPTIRGFARLFLRPLQLEVKEAADGAQALEIVRAEPPALAIVDVNMPGMDGLSFTREVRSDARVEIARVPIVLLTGDRLDDMREKGRIAGATDFLAKPLKGPELLALVKRFLGLAA
jgi:two-component system chemotaxis response regulator CheY